MPRVVCDERMTAMSGDDLDPVFQQLQALIAEHGWTVRRVGAFANAPRSPTRSV
jgi:hypothetical protein